MYVAVDTKASPFHDDTLHCTDALTSRVLGIHGYRHELNQILKSPYPCPARKLPHLRHLFLVLILTLAPLEILDGGNSFVLLLGNFGKPPLRIILILRLNTR